MLRFDPTRSEHTKFIEAKKRKAPKSKEDKNAAKRFKDDNENDAMGNNLPEVSSDQYFKVSDRLKSSIGRTTGFSVLQMFGRSNDNEQANDKNLAKSRYQEIPIAQNAKGPADFHPFNYDSSDGEDDEKKASKGKATVAVAKNAGKIWHEPFFMLNPKDSRFSGKSQSPGMLWSASLHSLISHQCRSPYMIPEGLSLFSAPEREPEGDQEKATKQQELRNIVKRKIKKSVKNSLPRHAKPNKRFKRMTKDF